MSKLTVINIVIMSVTLVICYTTVFRAHPTNTQNCDDESSYAALLDSMASISRDVRTLKSDISALQSKLNSIVSGDVKVDYGENEGKNSKLSAEDTDNSTITIEPVGSIEAQKEAFVVLQRSKKQGVFSSDDKKELKQLSQKMNPAQFREIMLALARSVNRGEITVDSPLDLVF